MYLKTKKMTDISQTQAGCKAKSRRNPLWIPRLFNAKSRCVCRNRRYFRLFRYTLDRGIIEVNVGVEVRLDKPKTRISYADTRVFAGGVREIWTLAAVSHPTPLAGAPLRPLEYYSTSQSEFIYSLVITKWRRGWDSNPWSARADRWFSRPVP